MKHLVFEMSHEGLWRLVFGIHSENVQVIEALKCLRCDQDCFAIICKIRLLDKNLNVKDLAENSRVEHIEILYKDRSESFVVFISGSLVAPKGRQPPKSSVFCDRPPEFLGRNRMKISLVGEEVELQKFVRNASLKGTSPRILSLARLRPPSEPGFPSLSSRQKQSILTAYSLGYYDVPRRISSKELAELLKINKSTLAEHLRKAERGIMSAVLVK